MFFASKVMGPEIKPMQVSTLQFQAYDSTVMLYNLLWSHIKVTEIIYTSIKQHNPTNLNCM